MALFTWAFYLIAIAALALLVWAIRGDRSRGRRRCPRCWYPLDAGLKCPECGREVASEKQLFRSRRRWWWAALAVLLVLASPLVSAWPKIAKYGWLSIVPTRVVVELLPLQGLSGPLGKELDERISAVRLGPVGRGVLASGLSREEHLYLLRRCVEGNWLARPIDEKWKASYGAILRGWNARLCGFAGDGEIQDPLGGPASPDLLETLKAQGQLPAELTVKSRGIWVEGRPIHVQFDVAQWWPIYMLDDVDCRWTASNGAAAPVSGKISGRGGLPFSIPLSGTVTLDIDVDIKSESHQPNDHSTRLVQTVHRQLTYRTVATFDECLTPVSGPEIDKAVGDNVHLSWAPGRGLMPDMTALNIPNCDDVAFGMTAEIMKGDEVVEGTCLRWLGNSRMWTMGGWPKGMPVPYKDSEWEAVRKRLGAAQGEAGWTVRLRTDPQSALEVIDAKRYWKGEVVIPLEWGNGMPRPVITRTPAPK